MKFGGAPGSRIVDLDAVLAAQAKERDRIAPEFAKQHKKHWKSVLEEVRKLRDSEGKYLHVKASDPVFETLAAVKRFRHAFGGGATPSTGDFLFNLAEGWDPVSGDCQHEFNEVTPVHSGSDSDEEDEDDEYFLSPRCTDCHWRRLLRGARGRTWQLCMQKKEQTKFQCGLVGKDCLDQNVVVNALVVVSNNKASKDSAKTSASSAQPRKQRLKRPNAALSLSIKYVLSIP